MELAMVPAHGRRCFRLPASQTPCMPKQETHSPPSLTSGHHAHGCRTRHHPALANKTKRSLLAIVGNASSAFGCACRSFHFAFGIWCIHGNAAFQFISDCPNIKSQQCIFKHKSDLTAKLCRSTAECKASPQPEAGSKLIEGVAAAGAHTCV